MLGNSLIPLNGTWTEVSILAVVDVVFFLRQISGIERHAIKSFIIGL